MFHKKLAMLFIMTSLFTFATYIAQAQDGPLAIVTDGLVSYWTFDEIKKSPKNTDIVEDIVGDNDGILQHKQKVVKGKYGNALEFDGVKDFIILDAHKLPQGNSAMSISAWIFKEKKGNPGHHSFVHIGVNCCKHDFWMMTFVGQRRLNNQLRMGQSGGGDTLGREIELGKWHHVAAVYDGAKKNLLYLDGVEVATKELDFEPDIQPGPIPGKAGDGATLGGHTRKAASWEGLLDEIGIYNRGLTPADVQRIANAPQIFAVESGGKLSLVWGVIKAAR